MFLFHLVYVLDYIIYVFTILSTNMTVNRQYFLSTPLKSGNMDSAN